MRLNLARLNPYVSNTVVDNYQNGKELKIIACDSLGGAAAAGANQGAKSVLIGFTVFVTSVFGNDEFSLSQVIWI